MMIKSMTGFGRSEVSEGDRKLTIEMKAVNHRYLDINIKIPKKLNFFESAIRSEMKKYIQRGKVDIFFSYEDFTENKIALKYNEDLAKEYLHYFKKMSDELGLQNDVQISELSRFPEILTMEEQSINEEELWNLILKAIGLAGEKMVETRKQEGEILKQDLLFKLADIEKHVDFIEKRSPDLVKEFRNKIEEKVKELLGDTQIEESRLATELILYADKICVDEELVRLRSHVENTKFTLEQGGSIGRKLDFIAQEMNREANTILSKANDLEISNHAIDIKTEIEKIREQIQNIE